MSSFAHQLEDQPLHRYLGFSFGLHAALLLALLLKAVVFPSSPLVLQPVIHIDLVGLPDQVKAPETAVDLSLPVADAQPPPAPQPVVAQAREPELIKPVEIPKAPAKDSAKEAKQVLEKLKQEVAKQQKTDERNKMIESERQRLQNLEQRTRQALRGNQVNQGTSTSGVTGEAIHAYASQITERLRSNWALPSYLQQRSLRAVARIYIDAQGGIQNYSIRQSSGNEAFDNYVKLAIQNSNPFAAPPAEMAAQLLSSGLEVIFPL